MAPMIMTSISIRSNSTNYYYLNLIKVGAGNTGAIKSIFVCILKLDKFISLKVGAT